MSLFLLFLKNNWQLVGLLLFLLAAGGYVVYINHDRDSLQAKLDKVTTEYEAFKTKAALQKEQFEKDAKLARQVSDEVLRQKEIVLEQEYTDKVERIKHDQAIASIAVPRSSVRLLNDTTRSATFTGVTPKPSQEADSTQTSPIALTIIFETVAENNKNHLSCVNQVLEFQDFYNKLRGLANANPN